MNSSSVGNGEGTNDLGNLIEKRPGKFDELIDKLMLKEVVKEYNAANKKTADIFEKLKKEVRGL